jgi:hypothetical protein
MENMDAAAFAAGLSVTLLVGVLASWVLKHTVTVPFPPRFATFETAEKLGGGRYLGIFERLLFFYAFSFDANAVAAGWLAFKLGAKWASWQHVTKIPEGDINDESYQGDKRFLSSRLLGRFLNGTAYNVACGGIGAGVVQVAKWYGVPESKPLVIGLYAGALACIICDELWHRRKAHKVNDGNPTDS